MNDDLVLELTNRNLELINRIEVLGAEIKRLQEGFDDAIGDNQKKVEENTRLQTQIQTWQSVVDELAHSINTDVFVAVDKLDPFIDNPEIKMASYHVRQIRDLTNLLMWYIKRNEISLSGDMAQVDVVDCIKGQITLIKDGISTLRINKTNHRDTLRILEVPVVSSGSSVLSIQSDFKAAIPLIFKDMLRNAFKNTQENSPIVSVDVYGCDENIVVTISNNRAIDTEFSDWFNGTSNTDPKKIQKSSKVGLRVIKMWNSLLKIQASLLPDPVKNETTATIILPKRIMI